MSIWSIIELTKRVTALEKKLRKMEIDAACAKGQHEWELCLHGGQSYPHTRCMHCYFHPKNKPESTVRDGGDA